ncbi:GDP-mannose 4,6-dehydratase [Candidatus Bathyarchaeota archaeon]|nr:GDP-mannose 4,6-dehydratase [Candidatus Bathyarchaeota archaeon]
MGVEGDEGGCGGGAGYLGSALVSRLLEEDYGVLSVDNLRRGDYGFLKRLEGDPRLRLVVADIRDRTRLEEVFRDFGGSRLYFTLPRFPVSNSVERILRRRSR